MTTRTIFRAESEGGKVRTYFFGWIFGNRAGCFIPESFSRSFLGDDPDDASAAFREQTTGLNPRAVAVLGALLPPVDPHSTGVEAVVFKGTKLTLQKADQASWDYVEGILKEALRSLQYPPVEFAPASA